MKRLLFGFLFCFTSATAHAGRFDAFEALARFFKGADESSEAARKSSAAIPDLRGPSSPGKGLEHLPSSSAHDLSHGHSLIITPAPKPDFSSKITAKNQRDLETYKSLRSKASNGDGGAMLKMSEFTRSEQVTDPGEPYYAYWLFQAVRLGVQGNNVKKKSQEVCQTRIDRRRLDRWFDSACSSIDQKNYYTDAGSQNPFIDQFLEKKMIRRTESQK